VCISNIDPMHIPLAFYGASAEPEGLARGVAALPQLGGELALEVLHQRVGGIAAPLELLRRQIGCVPEPVPPAAGDDVRLRSTLAAMRAKEGGIGNVWSDKKSSQDAGPYFCGLRSRWPRQWCWGRHPQQLVPGQAMLATTFLSETSRIVALASRVAAQHP
jgi:hypothetical protein